MSLFSRACQRTSCAPAAAPTSTCRSTSDSLQNTVHHIQQALQPQHTPTAVPRITPHPTVTGSSAVWCAVGLAAVAGAALYASRNPRVPAAVHPVEGFDVARYLGKWYEVARIDQRYERGLQRTQAEYSTLRDGSVQVINRGYDPKRNAWKVAHGKAKFTIAPDIAALKVSFFGPFYAGYNVVALDKDYRWAMVIGSSLDYFWILSRTPTLPNGVEDQLMRHASQIGVDTDKVLWVHQDGVNPTGRFFKK